MEKPVSCRALTEGIPDDLYQLWLENRELYEELGKPPTRHYDETVPGEVTVISYYAKWVAEGLEGRCLTAV